MDRVRDWKPGDVAMVRRGPAWSGRAMFTLSGWIDQGGDSDANPPLFDVTEPRPLVVIDPEDRTQAERLMRGYRAAYYGEPERTQPISRDVVDALQAALREFANPTPRIEEPTGLGAVVEDAEDDLWVLIDATGADIKPVRQWRTWWGNRPWDDINVVRVLSEGVS